MQPLHYLCKECYAQDDGEPRDAGEEIIRLERERDEARAMARDMRNQLEKNSKARLIFPWENANSAGDPPTND